jgi:DNA-binding NtrC family response regulator
MARILLVDDEQVVLDTVAVLLKSEGHQVVAVRESSQAFDLIWSSEVFDLLITDIRMSPVDGMQMIKVAQEFRPEMPILVISAYLDAKTIRQVEQMGVSAYVKKPFSAEDVLSALSKVLKKDTSEADSGQ